jgi:DnaJ-domain-containing protein 1
MGMKWIWILLAIVYVLSRIDLIPDVFIGWGWIDDIVVLYLLWRYLARLRQASNLFQQPGAQFNQGASNSGSQQASGQQNVRSPYEILEVKPDASEEEIRAAYRRLANQYHPDKVAHLGNELQELADLRFKEIQEAYQLLQKK